MSGVLEPINPDVRNSGITHIQNPNIEPPVGSRISDFHIAESQNQGIAEFQNFRTDEFCGSGIMEFWIAAI